MSDAPVPKETQVVADRLDALLKRHGDLSSKKESAVSADAAIKTTLSVLLATIVDPIDEELEVIEEEAVTLLTVRRKGLLARFGRTIKLSHGVIKFRVNPKSVEVPKDPKPIINWLVNRRGGKRLLRKTYALDKDALAAASPALLRRMNRSFTGFWVGRHETIAIQAIGEEKSKIISRRRYPRTSHQ